MRFQIPVGRVYRLPDAIKVGMTRDCSGTLCWLGLALFCLFGLLLLLRLRDGHQRRHGDRADESVSHYLLPILRRCFRLTE
jgi:hypothetical protein